MVTTGQKAVFVIAAIFLARRYYVQSQYAKDRRKRLESFSQHIPVEKSSSKKQLEYDKLWKILKLSRPPIYLVTLHSIFLILRTLLSVWVAQIDGFIVKTIINKRKADFLRGLSLWFAISLPATFTNSILKYIQQLISVKTRTNLTRVLTDMYMRNYYHLNQSDSQVDQIICNDVQKLTDATASLYSNVAKPVLDIIIFTYQLRNSIGTPGMVFIYINYVLTASLLKYVSPSFGRLAAVEAKLEGDFRSVHSRLITNAEEVAFYNGESRELGILDNVYKTLIRHVNRIYRLRIFYNMFEDFIIKYAWSAVGLLICSVPVFMPTVKQVAKSSGDSLEGNRTQSFIMNKRLMINLADAGGRVMYARRELAELAGYTERVHQLYSQLQMLDIVEPDHEGYGDKAVIVKDVPVATPGGDMLIRDLSFEVQPGDHLLISGSNGVGKSAVMRIIAGLWPITKGTMKRPFDEDMVFLPQRPYLSIGTLRDQIVYPLTEEQFHETGRTDADLQKILEIVHLDYLPDREGGFGAVREWKDVLSGGEKQRLSLARVFYHRPQYAVLDESTSAVSTDVEGLMYQRAQDLGITLITISHKPSLFKYHKYLLRLHDKTWSFTELSPDVENDVNTEVETLKRQIADSEKMQKRLDEINKQLGVKVSATKK